MDLRYRLVYTELITLSAGRVLYHHQTLVVQGASTHLEGGVHDLLVAHARRETSILDSGPGQLSWSSSLFIFHLSIIINLASGGLSRNSSEVRTRFPSRDGQNYPFKFTSSLIK